MRYLNLWVQKQLQKTRISFNSKSNNSITKNNVWLPRMNQYFLTTTLKNWLPNIFKYFNNDNLYMNYTLEQYSQRSAYDTIKLTSYFKTNLQTFDTYLPVFAYMRFYRRRILIGDALENFTTIFHTITNRAAFNYANPLPSYPSKKLFKNAWLFKSLNEFATLSDFYTNDYYSLGRKFNSILSDRALKVLHLYNDTHSSTQEVQNNRLTESQSLDTLNKIIKNKIFNKKVFDQIKKFIKLNFIKKGTFNTNLIRETYLTKDELYLTITKMAFDMTPHLQETLIWQYFLPNTILQHQKQLNYDYMRDEPLFKSFNSSLVSTRCIRFKPGYQRVWRKIRRWFAYEVGMSIKRQVTITKKVSRISSTYWYTILTAQQKTIQNIIQHTKFDTMLMSEFKYSSLFFLNGFPVYNIQTILNTGDLLQKVVTYTTYKHTVNMFCTLAFQQLKMCNNIKMHKLFYDQPSKRNNTYNPDFSVGYRFDHTAWRKYLTTQNNHYWKNIFEFFLDIPYFIEVDYHSLSLLCLAEHKDYYNPNPYDFTAANPSLRMLNWKYLF